MRLGLVGKFKRIYDEEYIARSFESLGVQVVRIEQSEDDLFIYRKIVESNLNYLLFTKWDYSPIISQAIKRTGVKTICWLFDLYWGYERQILISGAKYFKADHVFTTDGGNDDKWKKANINHKLIRQGIYDKECFLEPVSNPKGVVFIGSDNRIYPERTNMIEKVRADYSDFHWFGRNNTHAVRGTDLNTLFASKKIVLGDSVYSPYYWSNRVVETLGRGGFLIHRDVPGIKEEFPDLVTYDGTYEDLKKKIDYYLEHEDERLEIVKKNFEWVKSRYTMDKKCASLLKLLK